MGIYRTQDYCCSLIKIAILVTLLLLSVQTTFAQTTISGDQRLWHKTILTFDGPDVSESDAFNPFRNYRLDVTFTHSSGTPSIKVPGYYAADGNAANSGAVSGDKWRVNFMPTAVGVWNYSVEFYEGIDVAIATNPAAIASDTPLPHGEIGNFTVSDTNKSSPDFRYHGLLEYINQHYLQFAGSGEYYLKHGADSPENFLAYDDFDGTYDTGGILNNFLHSYAPHAGDWGSGDPQWDTGRGRNIIGALNYLASQDVNSIYLITYTIDGGDGGDTWPWTSDTERYRFDVSKLDQWEIVFSHMTQLGIQIHLVTQENENDELLGGDSTLNDIRRLYYRELVARFAHHPALQWNIGEENDNTDVQRNQFSQYIRSLDPYNHPTAVHTYYNLRENFSSGSQDVFYDNLIGSNNFEATSLQGDATNYNRWAIKFREESATSGRPWVVYGDEQGPRVASDLSNVDQIIRDAQWGNLMGGGAGVEWYFGYQGCCFGDLQQEDWRLAQALWQKGDIAIDFFYDYLPFWEMEPNNNLTSSANGDSWTFAKEDEIYALYLMDNAANNPTLNLGASTKAFDVFWYNPNDTIGLQQGSIHQVVGPGDVQLGTPPGNANDDWVALLEVGILLNEAPIFIDIADANTVEGNTLDIGIEVIDDDPVITLTAQVIRDSDNALMDNTFYNLTDQLDGTGIIQFTPPIGEFGTYTITLSADDGVNPLVEQTFILSVLETGSPGVLLEQSDGITRTSENGTTDIVEVYLNSQPTDLVIIDIISNDLSEVSSNPLQIIFDDTNWFIPQTVTLLGQDDSKKDGNPSIRIIFDTINSLDAIYANLPSTSVIVVNVGNGKNKLNSDDQNEDEELNDGDTIELNNLLFRITPSSDIYLLGATVDWQVEITNNTNQVIKDIEALLNFSSDDVRIISTQASKGAISTSTVALFIERYRTLQKRRNPRQTFLQPRVNYTHTDIAPGETLNLNIVARLDGIPSNATVTLNGELKLSSSDVTLAQDQATIAVVSVLPNTGEKSPHIRVILITGVLVFVGICILIYIRPIIIKL